MATRVAAIAAASLFGLIAVFQVALVMGAPWGEWTQGGAVGGALGASGRLVALVSALLLLGMAAVVLGVTGRGPLRLAPWRLLRVLGWLTVGYTALGVILNLASRSENERLLWSPVTALLLVLTLIVMLSTRAMEAASRSGGRGATARGVEEGPDSTGQDGG